ncbi:MAG: Rab family GTPase [Candidatus Thorarchaeota archaeon]
MELKPRIIKMAVVGSGGSGKTTLASRLATGIFVDKKMTIGFDVESWTVVPDGSGAIKVSCFDFGGQRQFRFFQGSLMTGAHAALIIVDCTSFHSLLEIDEWLPMIQHMPDWRKILVGTKIDLQCTVSEDDILEEAEKLGVHSVRVSSKTGENIEKLESLLIQIIKTVGLQTQELQLDSYPVRSRRPFAHSEDRDSSLK